VNWGDTSLPVRFWDKVIPEPNSGCWLWIGGSNGRGYGRFCLDGVYQYTHRIAVVASGRDMPAHLVVDHLCRNPSCCNPAHLDVTTARENLARGIKGALTTHCPKGHAYAGDNLVIRYNGWRQCRKCKLECDRRRYAENLASSGLVPPREGGSRSRRASCIRGHAFDAENTRVNADGSRVCRACMREHARRYAASSKEAA
jgi:hypothetical protein